MCGIAGEVRHHEHSSIERVDALLQRLLHRGPDASGVFAAGRGAIGQTRLAVIDLVTGDPPITTGDGAIGAVLNGEIYNYRELRERATQQGHRFTTAGDTEVIAHLAESTPPADLARALDGMFALAVWDTRTDRLVLARDRLGKKPLYWCATGTGIVFASEIKALLAHPDVPVDFEERALAPFLQFGYVPTPHTFFRGIHALPPAHVLVWERGDVRVERYWEPPRPTTGHHGLTGVDAVDLVRSELRAAVRRRLVADVPLGAFLSGGVDSAAVVALMAEEATRPVRTFTIGFDDPRFDERPGARVVARRFATEHHEFVVDPFAPEVIDELVHHHDQPFGDSSALPTYQLSRMTREHVTVAMSGDGGDELFAGYERFLAGVIANRLGPVAAPLGAAMGRLTPDTRGRAGRLRRFTSSLRFGMPGAYREWVSYTGIDDVVALTGDESAWWCTGYEELWQTTRGAHPLDRLLDLNLRTYLLDDLLPKLDRMSMAHALEVRSPLLDHHLLEAAARVSASQKIHGRTLKYVLRRAVRDLIPAETIAGPKRGFGVPLDRWFRDDLRAYTQSRLGSPSARIRSHLRTDAVDRVLAEHDRSAGDHGHTIWQLLTLESFLRERSW